MIFTAAFAYYLFSRVARRSVDEIQPDAVSRREGANFIKMNLQVMFIKVILLWPIYTWNGTNKVLRLPIVLGLLIFCMVYGFIPVYLLVGFAFATHALAVLLKAAERIYRS